MRLEELRNIFHIAALLISKKWDWKFMLKATKLSDDLVLSSCIKNFLRALAKSESGSGTGFCLPGSRSGRKILIPVPHVNPDIFHRGPDRVKPRKI